MTSPNLPTAVVAFLAQRLAATTRGPLRAAQAAMSAVYRDGGHSRIAVPDATAALAYAVARMPATYAANVRAFDLAAQRMPHFAPRSVLDIGAGPGTAALAAVHVWPQLTSARLIEPNGALAAVAADLMASATHLISDLEPCDMAAMTTASSAADLVLLSYVLAEQPVAQISVLVQQIAACVSDLIIIVEPGTPAGYARTLAARDALIAAGLSIIAPCPHAASCPLPQHDWCHFSVRLQRSAAHMQLKEAALPFEDERFSFVAAIRKGAAAPAAARLIRPVAIEKGFVDLALCTAIGLETRRVPRRDKAAYKAAKSLDWGDEA